MADLPAIAFVGLQNEFIDGKYQVNNDDFKRAWNNIEHLLEENQFALPIASMTICTDGDEKSYPYYLPFSHAGTDLYWKLQDILTERWPEVWDDRICEDNGAAYVIKLSTDEPIAYGGDLLNKRSTSQVMDIKSVSELHIVGLFPNEYFYNAVVETARFNPDVKIYVHSDCCVMELDKLNNVIKNSDNVKII